jgi:CRISPR-associated protein Cas2
MLKICRKYLTWVQNSVFEGEISNANYEKLIFDINKVIQEEEGDSIIIYKFRQMRYCERKVIGTDKKGEDLFI